MGDMKNSDGYTLLGALLKLRRKGPEAPSCGICRNAKSYGAPDAYFDLPHVFRAAGYDGDEPIPYSLALPWVGEGERARRKLLDDCITVLEQSLLTEAQPVAVPPEKAGVYRLDGWGGDPARKWVYFDESGWRVPRDRPEDCRADGVGSLALRAEVHGPASMGCTWQGLRNDSAPLILKQMQHLKEQA